MTLVICQCNFICKLASFQKLFKFSLLFSNAHRHTYTYKCIRFHFSWLIMHDVRFNFSCLTFLKPGLSHKDMQLFYANNKKVNQLQKSKSKGLEGKRTVVGTSFSPLPCESDAPDRPTQAADLIQIYYIIFFMHLQINYQWWAFDPSLFIYILIN